MDGLSFILQAWSSDAATSNIGTIHLRRPLVGGREGLLILRCFGGVSLVYDVTNEKINCNRKQAKEMTRKKEKHKNHKVCKPRGIYYPSIADT